MICQSSYAANQCQIHCVRIALRNHLKSFNEFFFAEKSSGFANILDVPAQPVVSRNYYYYLNICILYKYKMSIDLDDKLNLCTYPE